MVNFLVSITVYSSYNCKKGITVKLKFTQVLYWKKRIRKAFGTVLQFCTLP